MADTQVLRKKLARPELLRVAAEGGGLFVGGSQEWYGDAWQRRAGCGPTTASAIVWYLSASRPGLGALRVSGDGSRAHFLEQMEEMFRFITPGPKGVNTTAMFTKGAVAYGASRGVELLPRTVEIPPAPFGRPSLEYVREFVAAALDHDEPVAFLNLSNGSLSNLSNWHWVLLVALEPDSMMATMCDQGVLVDIALAEWLRTTLLGGGLVALDCC